MTWLVMCARRQCCTRSRMSREFPHAPPPHTHNTHAHAHAQEATVLESLLGALKAGVALPVDRLKQDFKFHGGELGRFWPAKFQGSSCLAPQWAARARCRLACVCRRLLTLCMRLL